MPRVTGSPASRARRKKWIKAAKGQYGTKSKLYKSARESVMKGLTYAYRDRKRRKRDFRRLWITRINAACRLEGLTYRVFVHGLKKNNISVDRKILADLAVKEPKAFSELVKIVQSGWLYPFPTGFHHRDARDSRFGEVTESSGFNWQKCKAVARFGRMFSLWTKFNERQIKKNRKRGF